MLARLPKREKRIIRLNFGFSPIEDKGRVVNLDQHSNNVPSPLCEHQLEQIGKLLGLSK